MITYVYPPDAALSNGPKVLAHAMLDFGSTNVTSSAYVTLSASVGNAPIKKIQVFMSAGDPLILAIGSAGNEVDSGYILPGGNGFIEWEIPRGARVSLKAVSTSLTSGQILVNFLG